METTIIAKQDYLFFAVDIARQNADWVIVYLHWGVEYATMPENRQADLARELIESGADIVIGAHPHVLQGIEFYQGSPIIYSLGNFWFNTGWVRTALLEIELNAQGEYRLRVHPCMTAGGSTSLMEEEADRQALFRHLEGLSTGIVIESDGVVTTIN